MSEDVDQPPTRPLGTKDTATVTPSGESLAPVIDGVRVHRTPVHPDHRGRVFEVYNPEHDFWTTPIVHTYVFTVRPGLVKGWGYHEHKEDRYCILSGEMLVVMWDGREGSPTHGMVQEVLLSPQATRMLMIPRRVWHVGINLGTEECMVMNHPTEPYDYANPDRRLLPWDSPDIPVDLRRYFPMQWGS
jgi:dTDP-4-dehydrorhamnose 3,5-epimerase